MADALLESGVIKIVSTAVFAHMSGWPWWAAAAFLACTYLYVHYGFASMTAHVTALYPEFPGRRAAVDGIRARFLLKVWMLLLPPQRLRTRILRLRLRLADHVVAHRIPDLSLIIC